MFNGKPVWKREDFTYEAVRIVDYVGQAIVDDAMDCVPPDCGHCFKGEVVERGQEMPCV